MCSWLPLFSRNWTAFTGEHDSPLLLLAEERSHRQLMRLQRSPRAALATTTFSDETHHCCCFSGTTWHTWKCICAFISTSDKTTSKHFYNPGLLDKDNLYFSSDCPILVEELMEVILGEFVSSYIDGSVSPHHGTQQHLAMKVVLTGQGY